MLFCAILYTLYSSLHSPKIAVRFKCSNKIHCGHNSLYVFREHMVMDMSFAIDLQVLLLLLFLMSQWKGSGMEKNFSLQVWYEQSQMVITITNLIIHLIYITLILIELQRFWNRIFNNVTNEGAWIGYFSLWYSEVNISLCCPYKSTSYTEALLLQTLLPSVYLIYLVIF